MRASHALSLLAITLAACVGLTGCLSEDTPSGGCDSHYATIASAQSWKELRGELLGYAERGEVASVRTVARGEDVRVGNRNAERVVDLLDRRDRRLAQVEVWRAGPDRMRAGIWKQCID